jgi:glycosyltransferase involved in cell wall biosynthesis
MPDPSIIERTAAVIPAYNAERHLGDVIAGVQKYIAPERIIVVDDGSTDRTAETARARGGVVLVHDPNQGKGAALDTGIRHAGNIGCAYAITLDADGQHRPDEIPRFIERWVETGADIIVGNRLEDTRGMPLDRKYTNYFTSWVVSRLAGTRIPDSQNGYRMISTSLYASLGVKAKRYEAESELLIRAGRAGARIDSVPVETIYADEVSSINKARDTYRFFRMVVRSFFW